MPMSDEPDANEISAHGLARDLRAAVGSLDSIVLCWDLMNHASNAINDLLKERSDMALEIISLQHELKISPLQPSAGTYP
jgi:hypothetical protein